MQATEHTNPIMHYARLSHNMLTTTVRQYESIERKFLLETKKDIIDTSEIDKCFTQLIILLEDVICEYKSFTNLVLGGE